MKYPGGNSPVDLCFRFRLLLAAMAIPVLLVSATGGIVTGPMKIWHTVTVTFEGPDVSEASEPNPFTDYRLNVVFTGPDGSTDTVPGYYAADGGAAESSADSGSLWQVKFTPDQAGPWSYTASFRTGSWVAVDLDPAAGAGTGFDGANDGFTILPQDGSETGYYPKGKLLYTGERYMRFAGDGSYYLKGGADSPETFLGYYGFDNTPEGRTLHRYGPHAGDWREGDPDWQNGKGKNIIGVINYLGDHGINGLYFLTLNAPNGDGRNSFPYVDINDLRRFDVSKLAQWDIVFQHMDARGVMLHVVFQEVETNDLLDDGGLGPDRKLYYRELIARFGYHLAITWNIGEEFVHSKEEIGQFCEYIKAVDPYDHIVVAHQQNLGQLLTFADLPYYDGPSYYDKGGTDDIHANTLEFVAKAQADAGRGWIVCIDETDGDGVLPDSEDPSHDSDRKNVLWGNLMAGGSGTEWYFGVADDKDIEDLRSRHNMFLQSTLATEFFFQHIPFQEMDPEDGLTSSGWCLAKPGDIYLVYLPDGGSADLDLSAGTGEFEVRWFNARDGGGLQEGGTASITGGGTVGLGNPPSGGDDWAVRVRRIDYTDVSSAAGPKIRPGYGTMGSRDVRGRDFKTFGRTLRVIAVP